jgi:transcriptional regulator with XRE-family HTH domain
MADPFEGIGKALARLRERAGFRTQTLAAEAVKIDKGQLSRWESENPRPTLDKLGRLLEGYGATAMDLALALEGVVTERAQAAYRGPSDDELIQALADAIRRIEGHQAETDNRIEQIEKELNLTG